MKHTALGLLLLLALLQTLLSPGAVAFVVTATPTIASTDSDSAPPLLEKTWTVTSGDTATQLQKLELLVAGNVFVVHDALLKSAGADNGVVAKVVVRGEAADLLDLMNVSATQSTDGAGIRLDYKNQHVHFEGLLVTQILVSDAHVLRSVSAARALNVVLGESVVVQEDRAAKLRFSLTGDGHIFVGSSADDAFAVRALKITVAGDGDVQFQSAVLQIEEELAIAVAGSGRVAVLATELIVADKVKSAIEGSGEVFVQTSSLDTQTLATASLGTGAATYSTSGSCVSQSVHLAGIGSVAAGSIVCQSADVSILGKGRVVLQATERLEATTLLTGSVKYVNERPKTIVTSGLVLKSSIQPAKTNTFETYTPVTPPSQTATRISVTVDAITSNDHPYVHAHEVPESAMGLQVMSISLPESMSALVLFEMAVVGTAVGALAVFRFRQRRIREKYLALP